MLRLSTWDHMSTHAVGAKLTRYPPGLRQGRHSHGADHLSLVLAGGHEEQVGSAEVEFGAGRMALRPSGMRHACRFSAQGALILTYPIPAGRLPFTAPRWSRPLPFKHLRALTPLLLEECAKNPDALWDLIALADCNDAPARRTAWISAVRDQLLEAPADTNLTSLAERAGRHRVHLGREFLSAFGETPSVFRQRAKLNRALCAMSRGVSPAAAAVDAGFADQSHLNRTCRKALGLTPLQVLKSAIEVASVQDKSP